MLRMRQQPFVVSFQSSCSYRKALRSKYDGKKHSGSTKAQRAKFSSIQCCNGALKKTSGRKHNLHSGPISEGPSTFWKTAYTQNDSKSLILSYINSQQNLSFGCLVGPLGRKELWFGHCYQLVRRLHSLVLFCGPHRLSTNHCRFKNGTLFLKYILNTTKIKFNNSMFVRFPEAAQLGVNPSREIQGSLHESSSTLRV